MLLLCYNVDYRDQELLWLQSATGTPQHTSDLITKHLLITAK